VELDVIFAHELNLLDVVLRSLGPPPLLPLVNEVGCYRDLPDGGIEPHLEHFVHHVRHDGVPLQVARDASRLQPLLEQTVGRLHTVVRPNSRFKTFFHKRFLQGFNLRQVQKYVV